ncbi:MAG TPA: sensor histidine kinase [Acidobacteriaceae bacterium]|nr:sensor histidine kinase [Acidobacteriaceae bacterium]
MDESANAPETLLGRARAAELEQRGRLWYGRGRWYDFIWLIYSAFFIIDPLERHSRIVWIEFGFAYAIFLALYTGLVLSSSRRVQYLLLIALGILGIVYYPYNGGSCGIFIYVSALVPFVSESLLLCVSTFIASAVVMMAEGFHFHYSAWSWGICAFFAIAVGAGNLVAAQRMRANRKLSLAHEQILHLAKLAERERIARDLHDVLGHTLSVVVLKAELAGKIMDRDPHRARIEIGEVEQIARAALGEVREAISGYRANGLAAEIERARKTLDAAGVALECGAKAPEFAPAEETVLSLIVREAVTNIVRHAHASHCRLEFAANGSATALIVEDDGRGGVLEEGNGLRGMRERVESLGGSLRIDTAQGDLTQGTRLVVELPPQALPEPPAAAPASLTPTSDVKS